MKPSVVKKEEILKVLTKLGHVSIPERLNREESVNGGINDRFLCDRTVWSEKFSFSGSFSGYLGGISYQDGKRFSGKLIMMASFSGKLDNVLLVMLSTSFVYIQIDSMHN